MRLVVVGGSAGALGPLRSIVSALPPTFPAVVLVCLHLAPGSTSRLPEILGGAGALPARHPRHGERLEPGVVLVAPPDRHLVVHDGHALLSRGPRENRHRPAVDPLFNSAARWHGPLVTGVVLSGALDDGAAGSAAIAAQDGTVIVQDPEEARIAAMPLACLRAVRRARAAPAETIADLLVAAVRAAPSAAERPVTVPLLEWESGNVDSAQTPAPRDVPGVPVAVGCPDCHGGMHEAPATNGAPHYVCHVGHSWSPESLIASQRQASESSLYAAAAKLVEESLVLRRVARMRRQAGAADEAAELETRAEQAEQRAQQVEAMVRAEG